MIRVLLIAFVGGTVAGLASEGPPPVLQPKTYSSPSGEFELFVDPSHRLGEGKGTYRLSRNGAVLWSAEQPFTLWEAVVDDEGWTAGYAYSNGWRDHRATGTLQVASFSPAGELVLDHSTRRTESSFFHCPPNPLATGLTLDTDSSRLLVRVLDSDINRGIEEWWLYSVKANEPPLIVRPEEHFGPAGDRSRRIQEVRSLSGVPLQLVWWWHYDYDDPSLGQARVGAIFSLVDELGREVWSLPLLDDYTVRGDEEADDALQARVLRVGALLSVAPEGRFAVWSVQAGRKLEFQATPNASGDGWTVHSLGSAEWQPPEVESESESDVQQPRIELASIAEVPLGHRLLHRASVRSCASGSLPTADSESCEWRRRTPHASRSSGCRRRARSWPARGSVRSARAWA